MRRNTMEETPGAGLVRHQHETNCSLRKDSPCACAQPAPRTMLPTLWSLVPAPPHALLFHPPPHLSTSPSHASPHTLLFYTPLPHTPLIHTTLSTPCSFTHRAYSTDLSLLTLLHHTWFSSSHRPYTDMMWLF